MRRPDPTYADRTLTAFATGETGGFALKLAEADALIARGLHYSSASISSTSVNATTQQTGFESKVADAAETMDRLVELAGELRSAHAMSVKVAAALAESIRLAQDGVIDVEDIFDVARSSMANGSVKLADLDQVLVPSAGTLADSPSSPASDLDPLTHLLRQLRHG